MRPRIGLIAGSGEFPLFVLTEAKRQGAWCAVLAVQEGTPPELESRADVLVRISPGRPDEAVAFLKDHGIRDVLFAGKIDPAVVFAPDGLDEAARSLIQGLSDRRPAALVRFALDFFAARGFRVMDPEPFLK